MIYVDVDFLGIETRINIFHILWTQIKQYEKNQKWNETKEVDEYGEILHSV